MRLALCGALLCVASFSAGYLLRRGEAARVSEGAEAASPSPYASPGGSSRGGAALLGGSAQSRDGGEDAAAGRKLELDPQFLSAVLSSGRLDKRTYQRMGLSEPEYSAIQAAGEAAMEAFKVLEKENAQAKSDERGEFVEIKAFPLEREQWLGDLEAELRSVLGDDRAAVLARMLAFADNDEEIGKYVREVFVMSREDGTMLIEERTFDQHGRLTDSDYETLGPNGSERWQHLLEFKTE